MTKSRRPSPSLRRAAEETLREDLRALHTAGALDLPTIESTARLYDRARDGRNPGGFLMSLFRRYQARPWPATAVVAGVAVAALLFMPVKYQKTIGQDVTLTVAVPALSGEQLARISSEFRIALRAASLSVQRREESGPVLSARVPGSASEPVARIAAAFAAGLTERGLPSTAQVTPRVERVLGNVYAYARDNIINIRVTSDGKTPAQIEAEIRDQLQAAGVEDPTVEYKKEGDRASLVVTMAKSGTAADGNGPCCPEVNISVDGREPGTGDTQGKQCRIRVNRTEGMTDAEVIADVQRQLREQGVDAEMTMEGGRIAIHPRNP
jgi:hypothetical protein